MKQVILDLWQENETLSMISQSQVITNYSVGDKIVYSTEVLKSNLCDFNDAYVLVSGSITIVAAPIIGEV